MCCCRCRRCRALTGRALAPAQAPRAWPLMAACWWARLWAPATPTANASRRCGAPPAARGRRAVGGVTACRALCSACLPGA